MNAAPMTPLETVLRRDRAIVLASLICVTVLAWLYLARLALDMAAGDMSVMGMGRTGAMDSTPWDGTTLALLYLMWLVMMMGMMVPSATPMILLYAVVKRKAAEKGHPVASANVFAAGYMVVWATFAAVAGTLHFLGRHWRRGTRGALVMGLEHGLFCVGCCSVLMTLLFVGGVMNLLWVAAIMVFVLLEKVAPYGHVLGRITGGALLVAGALLIAQA